MPGEPTGGKKTARLSGTLKKEGGGSRCGGGGGEGCDGFPGMLAPSVFFFFFF